VPKGICKLCLEYKELQDSHAMPKSFYKKSRSPSLKNPHPAVLTVKGSRQSSFQVSDYVFCSDCEQRFAKHGEDYVMRLVVQTDGRFPLLEQLEKTGKGLVGRTVTAYAAADTPAIDRDKVAYFAASLFWRAAVHVWRLGEGKFATIRFGPRYSEEFRKYLLGIAPFPDRAYLTTIVCKDKESHTNFFMPGSNIKNRDKVHIVMARGLTFFLGVGRELPERIMKYCLVHSPERWIMVRSCSEPHPIWKLNAD